MSRSLKVAVVVSMATIALLYAVIEHGRRVRASLPLHELPTTARAVLHVDISALEKTPAARALLGALVAKEQLTEIEATCGIAPLQSLSEITVWVRGPEEQPFQSIGLMLKGRSVEATALAECHRSLVRARGGSVVRLDAATGALLTSRDRRSAIGLLDDRTVVTGSVRTVAEAMAARSSLVPALIERASIAELWPRLSRNAAVAAVLEPPEHWKEALESVAGLEPGRSVLEGARALGFAIRSGSEGAVEGYVELVDAETARRNAARMEAWIGDPPASVEPPWSDLMRHATVETEGRMLRINLDVSNLAGSR
ncbi:MAG: hypothetical protein AMJ62_14510 [Myxococcales bacterium SG8_38]|nr:MAG: hypothetical protein AMJ62_14510 [Myxococcales bacterium SG8_38]